MKKALSILFALVGLLLAPVGVAGMMLIGSDDVVESPATSLPLSGAKAVVSTPELLAFADTTLRVSAENGGGSVFVGRAHPVDTTSYLEGVPTYSVTHVGTSGMSGRVLPGEPKATPADPVTQTFWTDTATGSGTQTLSLDLDGSPTTWVIVPLGAAGDLKVTSGLVIPHGFVLSVAALLAGAVMLVGGFVATRRRRRSDTSPIEATSMHTSHPRTAEPDEEPDRVRSSSTGSTLMTRTVTRLGVAVVLPALAGCGMVPTKVDAWQNASVTRPALTLPEAKTAMADYDRRNNAAIKAAATSFDARAWQNVDTGTVFAQDQYAAAHRRLVKKSSGVAVGTTTVDQVFAPAFGSYPMYALVSGSETWKAVPQPKPAPKPAAPAEVLVAMRRESATAPWRKMATAPAPWKALPRAAAPGTPRTPDAAGRIKVMRAVGLVTTRLNTGKGSVTLPKNVEEFLREWRTPESYLSSSTAVATLWRPDEKDQTSPAGSVQVARTATGHVALVSYLVRVDWVAKPGNHVYFENKEFAAVIGQPGNRAALRFRAGLTLAVTVDDQGTPTVVGGAVDSLI